MVYEKFTTHLSRNIRGLEGLFITFITNGNSQWTDLGPQTVNPLVNDKSAQPT